MTPDASLGRTLLQQLRQDKSDAHTRVLALVEDLTDEQLGRRLGSRAPAIGFHVWHLARWEDYDRSVIQGTPQIWQVQDLAQVWGFTVVPLGEAETGTEMGDDASERLVLPEKAALLDYVRSVFTATEELLDGLTADSLVQPVQDLEKHEHVLSLLNDGLTHLNRHLGMIEALRGLLDLRGTATR